MTFKSSFPNLSSFHIHSILCALVWIHPIQLPNPPKKPCCEVTNQASVHVAWESLFRLHGVDASWWVDIFLGLWRMWRGEKNGKWKGALFFEGIISHSQCWTNGTLRTVYKLASSAFSFWVPLVHLNHLFQLWKWFGPAKRDLEEVHFLLGSHLFRGEGYDVNIDFQGSKSKMGFLHVNENLFRQKRACLISRCLVLWQNEPYCTYQVAWCFPETTDLKTCLVLFFVRKKLVKVAPRTRMFWTFDILFSCAPHRFSMIGNLKTAVDSSCQGWTEERSVIQQDKTGGRHCCWCFRNPASTS